MSLKAGTNDIIVRPEVMRYAQASAGGMIYDVVVSWQYIHDHASIVRDSTSKRV